MDTFKKDSIARVRTLFGKGVHFCYDFLLAPRSQDEDLRRKELVLNVLLTSFIWLLLCLDIIILYNSLFAGYAYKGISFSIFSCIIAIFVFLWTQSRRGQILPASYVLIVMFAVFTMYGTYRWGVGMPAGLLCYGLLITMTSILISTRAAVIITAIIIGCLVIFGYQESLSDHLPYWRMQPVLFTDSIQYSVILLLTMTVALLSNREIKRSLARARKSESALLEKNDSLERILEERTAELHRAQADKMAQLYRFAEFGRLSSGIFHDLINPLSAVASNVYYLQDGSTADYARTNAYISKAVTASKRMEQFISAVKKQMSVENFKRAFAVNDEIEEVITLLNYKSTKETIVIEFHAFQKIETYGNPIKFQQIITNLLSNAIDAYDGLSVDDESHLRIISVQLNRKKDLIEINITDRGCGIPPDLLGKIFAPFFTLKPETRGMGLGLSTTKDVIEKDFGGHIQVESTHGAGSTFTICLPLINEPHAPERASVEADHDRHMP